jgi:hypothetical protein
MSELGHHRTPIRLLLDHFVRASEQRWWNDQSERLPHPEHHIWDDQHDRVWQCEQLHTVTNLLVLIIQSVPRRLLP